VTYGYGTGFSFGFTAGLPIGTVYRPAWGVYHGWHPARFRSYDHFGFNHYNVYRRWEGAATHIERPSVRGRPIEVPGRRPEFDRGRNNVYAAPGGGVYRRTDRGWEQRDGRQWRPAERAPQWQRDSAPLGRDESARRAGDMRSARPPVEARPRMDGPGRGPPARPVIPPGGRRDHP
jgi:hypothetical protein